MRRLRKSAFITNNYKKEYWQNYMGHGNNNYYYALKMMRKFSFCCKTYFDTLINPIDSCQYLK